MKAASSAFTIGQIVASNDFIAQSRRISRQLFSHKSTYSDCHDDKP
jgi:hypothetical protein